MSKNASGADNQQGSCLDKIEINPSETTRRAPDFRKVIMAYFFGAIHDGTFSSNGRFRISQKGDDWLKVLREFLKQIGFSSWIYKEGKTRDVYVLETLAKFLDFQFNPENLKTQEEKTAYVRGFFDAEGGIPHNKKHRFYIQLTQKDKAKIEKIKFILDVLGIKTGKIHNPSYKVDPNYWRIYILAKSQKLFVDKVGSWHPRKINILKNRVMI